MSILLVDDLFDGGGDEDVALLVQHVLTLVSLGSGEANNCSIVDPVVFQSLEINIFAQNLLKTESLTG